MSDSEIRSDRGRQRVVVGLALVGLAVLVILLVRHCAREPRPADPALPREQVGVPVPESGAAGSVSPPAQREDVAGAVRIRVVDHDSGHPVPRARFARVTERKSSYADSEWSDFGVADAAGVLALQAAELGGTGGLLVDSDQHTSAYLDLAGLVADVEVRLRVGHLVRARCLTLDGQPLPGVMVGIMRTVLGRHELAVVRRPGPGGDLPMVWQQSDADGSVAFPPLAEGDWQISARHPTHVMVAAPDLSLLRIPIEDFELRFAQLYVCMANPDPSLGAKVTFEYRPSKGRWRVDNSLASQYCVPLAAELREKFSAAVVAVAAVDLRHGSPEPIEGRILTEAGWHRFRADWRPLPEVGGPWLMEAEPVPPRVEWGEVEVFVVGRDGRPLDLGPGSSLAVGRGPIPSFQTSYQVGTRRRLPIGTYRLITPNQPYFSDAIADQQIVVRKGEITSEVVREPAGLVQVDFDLHIRGMGRASGGSFQARHGGHWQGMGMWSPDRRVFYVPPGPMSVSAVALGSGQRVNAEIVVHAESTPMQVVTIELPR